MTENSSNNVIKIIAIVVGVLVVLCCIGVLIVAGVAYFFGEDIVAAGIRETTQTKVEPYSTLPEAPPDDQMPPNGDLEAQFGIIEEVMIGVRGLELVEPVPRSFLSRSEYGEYVETDLLSDYPPEDAADDTLVLYMFDVVSRDFDLLGMYESLYTEGVAGFYDPEERAFYIIGEDENLDPEEEITYAHELVHVLQDQNFNLNEFMNYDDDEFYILYSDQAFARQAVVEGDATLSESLYEQNYMLPERVDQYYLDQLNYDASFLAQIPNFIISGFIFPYVEGADFVIYVYNQGGYDAVNALYEQPPLSTEQIIHPEKYFSGDDPIEVEVADALSVLEGYRTIYVSQMGEYGIREYLKQSLTQTEASDAAAGWGGDRYGAYVNDATGDVVLNFLIEWDSPAEATEFANLFASYQMNWDFSEDESVFECVERSDEVLCLFALDTTRTLIVRAPDLATAEEIRDLY